jgi:hypothetical protein
MKSRLLPPKSVYETTQQLLASVTLTQSWLGEILSQKIYLATQFQQISSLDCRCVCNIQVVPKTFRGS